MNTWTCDGPSPSEYADIPNECGHCGQYIETDETVAAHSDLGPGIWLEGEPYHLECEHFDRQQTMWVKIAQAIDLALNAEPGSRYRYRVRVRILLDQERTLLDTIRKEGDPIT